MLKTVFIRSGSRSLSKSRSLLNFASIICIPNNTCIKFRFSAGNSSTTCTNNNAVQSRSITRSSAHASRLLWGADNTNAMNALGVCDLETWIGQNTISLSRSSSQLMVHNIQPTTNSSLFAHSRFIKTTPFTFSTRSFSVGVCNNMACRYNNTGISDFLK